MKRILILLCFISPVFSFAQPANWIYLNEFNTGLGGYNYDCIRADDYGNIWVGSRDGFFHKGSVSRFDDTVFTCWSNFENYIPTACVLDVAFDHSGGLWVAANGLDGGLTNGGIAHYDGVTWIQYTIANTPFPDDNFRGICVDGNNHVWATFYNGQTLTGGVTMFDGSTWTVYTTANSNLPTFHVDKIMADAQNNIWIGSDTGLVKFDGTNWILNTTQNSGLSNNKISDVEFDATTGKIYAAGDRAIDAFDGSIWTHWDSLNSPLPPENINSMFARGDTIIITTSDSTYIYDGTNWSAHKTYGSMINCLIDDDGNFWIIGYSGVEKYDGNSWTLYHVLNTGLNATIVEAFVDSKNMLWFGSFDNGGINRFECPKWRQFNSFTLQVQYAALGVGITEDIYGDIWMVFRADSGTVVQVTGGDVNTPSAWHVWDNNSSGISIQRPYGAAADHTGNVWIGYDTTCSVARYEHASGTWTKFDLYQLGLTTCGAGTGIKTIKVDDSNNVWICGKAGLIKYDQTNWTFYTYLNTPMQQGTVYDIAFDSLGNKWVATEHGLYKFDGTNWTVYNSSNTIMFGDRVRCVLVDNNGIIRVGAGNPVVAPYPYGLFSFDGNTWTVDTASPGGLPDNIVIRMTLDTLGNIILLTQNGGVAIYNPAGIIGYNCLDKSLNYVSASIDEPTNAASGNMYSYPNPFSKSVTLGFYLTDTKNALIQITDVTGRTVKKIKSDYLHKGENSIEVDLSGFCSGVYFCNLISNGNNQAIKMVKE